MTKCIYEQNDQEWLCPSLSKETVTSEETEKAQSSQPDQNQKNGNLCRKHRQVWYIPHHGVYHPKIPNKIQVVFDYSSEFKV